MARQDLVRITASLAGRPLGEFSTFQGGELSSEDVKKSAGGGKQQRSRGGRQTVGNVTIGREFIEGLDSRADAASHRGRPDEFVIDYQPLDDHSNNMGPSTTYTGTLIRFAPGEADSDGDSTLDVEYEMSVSEVG